MTDKDQAISTAISTSGRLFRVTVWCAYISGVVSILGIALLVAFYATFIGPLGTLNDIAVSVQYLFMIPIAYALHRLLGHSRPSLSRAALLLGVVGMLLVIVLQLMLVTDVLTFGQQIGFVLIGFMMVLSWFVIIAKLGRSTDKTPNSMVLHVFAGLYFGYPVWAFSLARRLP